MKRITKVSNCIVCINELQCEFYHDDTSCEFSPINKICMQCKTMFDANEKADQFCSVACKCRFKTKLRLDITRLEIRLRFGKYTTGDVTMLEYIKTLEVDLIEN